ncbi:uncharacterized protein B0H18DRAFT_953308 [Fomitopsis serialis]|uniref:uncharacterized protein n=1 Tax=Fomitopsis serialis TaxID=139415 RepID=UPI0020088702|nr:uncharacterized protein B0H18DRAFT_1215188 [Neoantrodia serialis]XP_047895728.1 uncharacterized protein B0H18DRAFT_953308 [Neoantrodia serialis]KAH9916178.1 hypothetical protein B0H18DRAFT_1215188 [Neoantrodia serialis]KAH9930036.1 hypothetical protein B0H18DRAFT_953308 [Neoantrodia serialis]
MGQYWRLINIDRRQSISFECMKLGEVMFWRDPDRLIWLLATPRKPKPYQRSLERGHSKDPRDLGALNLPFDVLDLIFEHIALDNILDAAYLALTNSFLRVIGGKRIYEGMYAYSAPWSLDRLICVGDYLSGDDLPPDILKEDEEESLSGDCSEEEDGEDGARLYNAAKTWLDDDVAARHWDRKFSWSDTRVRLSHAEDSELNDLVELDYSWDGTPETEWILCNWTLAQYVRASAVAKLTGTRCHGPWANRFLGLGHVLLTQICWSSDDSVSMRYEGPIHRGSWAGHYVAITTVDQLTENRSFADKKDWTDVTEVLEIWRADNPETLAPHLRSEDYVSDNTNTDEEDLQDQEESKPDDSDAKQVDSDAALEDASGDESQEADKS